MNNAPMIKPLDWISKSEWHWIANNPFGECWIKNYAGQHLWTLYGPGHYGPGNNFNTLEEALNAAQEDYEQRVSACIHDAAIAAEREACAKVAQAEQEKAQTNLNELGREGGTKSAAMDVWIGHLASAVEIGIAIRARKDTE